MNFNPLDLLKLGGQSFVTQTAYIKIRDLRSMGDAGLNLSKADKATGGSASGLKGLNNLPGGNLVGKQLDSLKEKAQDAAKNAAGSAISGVVGDSIGGMIGGALGLKSGPGTADDYDKVFKVQFNPISLQISSQGGGEIVQKSAYAQSKAGTTIEMSVTMPHVEMAVQLIFDGLTDNYKAFAGDLANFSSTNLVNEGVGLAEGMVSDALGGTKAVGVQSVVEGFIGAMRNKYTRQVCFEWGDLYYEGELKSINATYTMFDSVGRPVRAKVNMAIYLEDENVNNTDMGHWESAYDEIFAGGSVDLSGEKMLGNVMGDGKVLGTAKSILNF